MIVGSIKATLDKTMSVWIKATDNLYGNEDECTVEVTLVDKSAPPYFTGTEISSP